MSDQQNPQDPISVETLTRRLGEAQAEKLKLHEQNGRMSGQLKALQGWKKARETEMGKEERTLAQVIAERDHAEAWADMLSKAIGGEEIGEHSSLNNPWKNALDIAEMDRSAPASDPARSDQSEGISEDQVISAALVEYHLEHIAENDDERRGRQAAVRGMMVRLDLYARFSEQIDHDPGPDPEDEISSETVQAIRNARGVDITDPRWKKISDEQDSGPTGPS